MGMEIGISLSLTGTITLPAAGGGGPTEGPELLANGDMSSATGWVLSDGSGLGTCEITGGVLHMADPEGTSPFAGQTITVNEGSTYRVAFTIVSISGGGAVTATIGGGGGAGTARLTTGTFSEDIVAASENEDCRFELANGECTIDNASCKLLS